MKRYLFESKLGRCKRRVILRKVLLFMIVNLIFTACSSSSKENTFEIYGEEKQEIIGEYTERFLEPIERRSEEHTSELQSRGHLVCRLLLEKKKYTKNKQSRA